MNDLGNLQSVHKSSKLFQFYMVFCAFVFFGLAVLVIFIFSLSKADDLQNIVAIGLVAMVLILIGIAMIWFAFRRKNEELCLYENGLTYSNGEITQTVKWDEIHSVYEFAFRTVVTYSITTKDDQDLIFEGHFKNIKQIGERLKYEAEIRNLPIIWGVASDYRSNLLSVIPK